MQIKHFTLKRPHSVSYIVTHFMEWSPWNVCPVSQLFQMKLPVYMWREEYQQLIPFYIVKSQVW